MPPKKQTTLDQFSAEGTKKRQRDVIELDSEGSLNLASTIVDPEWKKALSPLMSTPWYLAIEAFLAKEYADGREIFPAKHEIFAAFNYTPWQKLSVVLIGQDPYHDVGQAHGLCFSVRRGVPPPPSLKNMFKELATDIPGFTTPSHGDLTSWAQQGILMLNATLTVQAHNANSHAKCGWQMFTDEVIKLLSSRPDPLVFLLWGGFAQKKAKLINTTVHHIISCAHPSPLSAKSWFGCKTFSKCNEKLKQIGKPVVNWNLPQ